MVESGWEGEKCAGEVKVQMCRSTKTIKFRGNLRSIYNCGTPPQIEGCTAQALPQIARYDAGGGK